MNEIKGYPVGSHITFWTFERQNSGNYYGRIGIWRTSWGKITGWFFPPLGSFHQTQAPKHERVPGCSQQTGNLTKVRSCLAFPCSLSLSLSPRYLFFGVSFWHSAFNPTLSWPVLLYWLQDDEWKEGALTWPGRGYPMQGNQAPGQQLLGVTGYLKLFFHEYSVVL